MTLPGHLQDKTGATPTCLLAETMPSFPLATWAAVLYSMGSFSWGVKHCCLLLPLKEPEGMERTQESTLFPGHFTFLRPSSCVLHLAASSSVPSLRRRG